jgi:hypothetical protein
MRVARPLSKTTAKAVTLGREKDTAPFVLADTREAVGLTDTAASETKLFNDERGRVRDQ